MKSRVLRILLALAGGLLAFAVAGALAVWLLVVPGLPDTNTLRDVRFQVPLKIYAGSGELIAEYGEKRRSPVHYRDIPPLVIKAFLAAEDDRFFEHPGVDYQGILRAAYELIRTGHKRQGGSTITMQVARNFFLTREKTYTRKLREILLALKIERELTKQQILELYLNKIYLGQRAYGVAAAAEVYYGKPLDQLTVDEIATIAGLPKAPSRDNPIASPERARVRRNYVLRRMHELGFIDDATYRAARAAPIHARLHTAVSELPAGYVAEMVRTWMVDRFGEAAYTDGYRVYTTLDGRHQRAAVAAVHRALLAYSRRHGYRGPERHFDLPRDASPARRQALLRGIPTLGGLAPALVTAVAERSFTALLADGTEVEVPWRGLAWARRRRPDGHLDPRPRRAADVVAVGDLVRLEARRDKQGAQVWWLAQVPEVQGALVSVRPDDGAILALVGGYAFPRSKFNRVTQARRQPGSSFKPFIYSAALEKGFTAASIINDAPVVFDDPGLEEAWRPENYSGRFYGPTRLREALVHSRNLVSIRLLREIGIDYALRYVRRFGFDPTRLPRNLSLALGSGSLTPLEMVRGYAVFANGGYRVEPWFIARVLDRRGNLVYEAEPAVVCRACETAPPERETAPPAESEPPATVPRRRAPRVIEARNAWLMGSMMRDVVRRGTGRRALQLGRRDLAGKTGTTNDQRDAWFCGFDSALVAVAWVGFDDHHPLGARETGSRAALPLWMAYMRVALQGVPERIPDPPPGLVTVRIDPRTGLLADSGQADAVFETFRKEYVPRQHATAPPEPGAAEPEAGIDELF
ncbi:MAG: penicillin-binding protein 1A, partial [Gammaproteobacteria bacterium]